MAKKINHKDEIEKVTKTRKVEPWIEMRSGLVVIAITSLAMAVLTFIQLFPSKGWGISFLWALIFGLLIWAIFWGFYFFRKIFR